MKKTWLLVLILGLLVFAGCLQKPAATVNGAVISQAEVEKEAARRYGKEVLDDLIIIKLVDQDFNKKKLKLDEKDMQERSAKMMELYSIKNKLESGATSQADFMKNYRMLSELRMLLGDKINEARLKTMYDAHKDSFSAVHPQVLICTDAKMAAKIQEDLKKGADFGKLAAQFNPGELKKNNGDLGFLLPSDMALNILYKAGMEMKPGQVKMLPLGNGEICLVKLLDKWTTFDQVRFLMEDGSVTQLAPSLLQELKSSAKIKTMYDQKAPKESRAPRGNQAPQAPEAPQGK